MVETKSESVVVVKNSSLKWTIAWAFFLTVLFIPALYCLVESQNRTPQGGEIVPVVAFQRHRWLCVL